jgi:hypothetical protein
MRQMGQTSRVTFALERNCGAGFQPARIAVVCVSRRGVLPLRRTPCSRDGRTTISPLRSVPPAARENPASMRIVVSASAPRKRDGGSATRLGSCSSAGSANARLPQEPGRLFYFYWTLPVGPGDASLESALATSASWRSRLGSCSSPGPQTGAYRKRRDGSFTFMVRRDVAGRTSCRLAPVDAGIRLGCPSEVNPVVSLAPRPPPATSLEASGFRFGIG